MSDERRQERSERETLHEERVKAILSVAREVERMEAEIQEYDAQIADKRKALADLKARLVML